MRLAVTHTPLLPKQFNTPRLRPNAWFRHTIKRILRFLLLRHPSGPRILRRWFISLPNLFDGGAEFRLEAGKMYLDLLTGFTMFLGCLEEMGQ